MAVINFESRFQLAVTPQAPDVDLMLYVRPFHKDAWLLIAIMMLIIAFCLIGPHLFVKDAELTKGHQVLKVKNTLNLFT